MNKTNQITAFIVPILLLLSYAILLSHPINLVTADLGRHIINGGEVLSGNFSVLKTNFYSYTFPGYPTLNHHWLGGVIFFLIWKVFGFFGVHIFFILISLVTLFVFFKLASEKSGPAIASLVTMMIIPLILERDEIRPEIFSNFLAAIFLYILTKYKEGKISPKFLLILPIIELIWVNTHIYFFLGFVIVGAFLAEAFFEKSKPAIKTFASTIGLMFVAIFINPAGVRGVLAPFDIFKNYGYTIVENQNIFFLEKLLKNPNFLILKIMFFTFLFLIISRLIQNKRGIPIRDLIFATGFSIAAFLALRNVTIFALFALSISSACIAELFGNPIRNHACAGTPEGSLGRAVSNWAKINLIVSAILGLFILSILSGEYKPISPYGKFGFGVLEGNNNAAKFIKNKNLEGPIFNNYDIGGYLIFNLWPERKAFVDNRPEAYPNDFFQKVYIPMQENEEIWQEQLKIYGFKTIVFSYLDYTPWGQQFLARITKDPKWSTVFKDERVIILVHHIK